MISESFGLYLLGKNILEREQVLDIVNSRNHRRISPELIVFSAGFMTEGQIQEVMEEQVLSDKTFSEISCQRGYLTFENIEEMVGGDVETSLKISQAALDKEYLTLEQWFAIFAAYKKECEITPDQFNGMQGVDYRMIVRVLLDFSTLGDRADMYYDYVAGFLRNIIRMLDEEPGVFENFMTNSVEMDQLPDEGWAVNQDISVEGVPLRAVFFLDDDALVKVAGKFSKETFSSIDELVLDSIKEFFNLSNGILVVNLSNSGVEADLLPPTIVRSSSRALVCGQAIPIGLGDCKMYLLLDLAECDGYEWCRY